ncbi:hypothetical protein JD844_012808 [Phrynosoma platyrhinos]|uniref:Dynein heavy chain 12, axonemal n=1 Tax=Phrynosoma platyrhinos TaxID=52577 RepID=A0ABQ7TL25_PHRPL|nr:hypothetical protein JD844_012808 [Phrynosoma platyrhinos]
MSAPSKSSDLPDDDAQAIRLPPIAVPSTSKELTEKQKKLMKYRRVKEQQKILNKIIVNTATKEYSNAIEEFARKESQPPIPQLPYTMNSEQKQIRTNYLFLKKCVESNPVVPIQQEWLHSMLTLIPQNLMEGKDREKLVEELLDEVTNDYEMSMKRYMVRSVLVKPSVTLLEYEKEEPLPVEPVGLDFSRPWHISFLQARKQIFENLHILHPTLRILLDIGYKTFSKLLIVDLSDFSELIFQLKELLKRTVEAYVQLFDFDDQRWLLLFKMELTFDDEKMDFYPSFQDLEDAILFIVTLISQTLQHVQTIHSWLGGTSAVTAIDTELPEHVISWASSVLKKAVHENLKGPKAHFDFYVEKYGWLVDGAADDRIRKFVAEEHSFDEYAEVIFKYNVPVNLSGIIEAWIKCLGYSLSPIPSTLQA